jgi:peptidyl-prolyl cis-trans isomerase C
MLRSRYLLAVLLLGGAHAAVQAQQPPAANAVAATVNGQPIQELAVYRALMGAPAARYTELRPEVLNFLIENALVDQYLEQMKVNVDAKEVDAQLDKVKAEIVKTTGKKLEDFYTSMLLTEVDLRAQVFATLRWDKFIDQFAVEKTLREFHDGNKAIFDGSQMRAKHILIAAAPGNAQQAKAKIGDLKKEIEDKVAQGLAAAGNLDKLELQKKRMKLLETAFAEVAARESACPSKNNGGEVGWFTRVGDKVSEPFARAAFGLKPYEMSDAVPSDIGYHLILAIDSKAGKERKFEDIRAAVREVYAERMREAIVTRARQASKIDVAPAPK